MKVRSLLVSLLLAIFSITVLADIPPPKEVPPTDWSFVLMGVIAAFLGGLLFVWLGRKLFRRPQ
ncbi:MAG: hypothetical protein IPM59_05065 [Chloracidobacterium sp.]|nr:hypothetical protein [Chloracidobacterium sp.]